VANRAPITPGDRVSGLRRTKRGGHTLSGQSLITRVRRRRLQARQGTSQFRQVLGRTRSAPRVSKRSLSELGDENAAETGGDLRVAKIVSHALTEQSSDQLSMV
jgi:hypothetical protein